MTQIPIGMATAITASIHTLLGIIFLIVGLSIFPSYVFDDVLGFEDSKAYTYSAIVWLAATVGVAGSRFDFYASYLLYQEMGWDIESPLVIAGVILTITHFLAAFGAIGEENDQSVHTES